MWLRSCLPEGGLLKLHFSSQHAAWFNMCGLVKDRWYTMWLVGIDG